MSNQVPLEDLDHARSEQSVIIDVREPEEYAAGHVPGSQNIPLSGLVPRVDELPKDRPVYVVCQRGGRNMEAAAVLSERGVDARSVAGGTEGWAQSGRPIQAGA